MDADTLAAVEAVALAVTLLSALGIGVVFVRGLLRAGLLPHPMSLVVALAMLAFVSIIAYAVTKAGELAAVASAAVGALAGAVSSSYRGGNDDPPDKV